MKKKNNNKTLSFHFLQSALILFNYSTALRVSFFIEDKLPKAYHRTTIDFKSKLDNWISIFFTSYFCLLLAPKEKTGTDILPCQADTHYAPTLRYTHNAGILLKFYNLNYDPGAVFFLFQPNKDFVALLPGCFVFFRPPTPDLM